MRLVADLGDGDQPLPDGISAAELYGWKRTRRDGRPTVEICMITTPDGVTSVGGRSGPLGGDSDRAVLVALRSAADWVLVGGETVRAEHYRRPSRPDLRVAVVTASGDISVAADLASSDIVTLVMPEDGPETSLPSLRVGTGRVDLIAAVGRLDGDFVHVEGGPSLNAQLLAAGLVDAVNLTFSPSLGGGPHRPVFDGDPAPVGGRFTMRWVYEDDGLLFARYERV